MKFKNMTMVFLERSISNGTTTVENVINNKELLKYATDNLKELWNRGTQKVNQKKTLKNANYLLTGRQWIINVCESGIFSMIGINDDGDFIYDNEFMIEKYQRQEHWEQQKHRKLHQ